jgi:hypothetical protein
MAKVIALDLQLSSGVGHAILMPTQSGLDDTAAQDVFKFVEWNRAEQRGRD